MKLMLPFQNQPKIFAAFKSGYETVSKHLYLVLFPIFLDLFLLFGYRITITEMIQDFIQQVMLPASATPEIIAYWETLKNQMIEFFRYFSLTSFLRALPAGVPSLFYVAAFERNPLGEHHFIHLQRPGSVILVIIGMSLIGLLFGYFLYRLLSKATSPQPATSESFLELRSLLSWILIPIISITFMFVVIIPAMLLISLIGALLPIFTMIGYFFLTIGIVTLLTPFIFTPHLIFLEHKSIVQALLTSFRTVRLTNAKSTTFIFLGILVSYLTNMLWRIPSDDSWMLMVSIFGHGMISIILLAASFHFVIDARQRVRDFTENQIPVTTLEKPLE